MIPLYSCPLASERVVRAREAGGEQIDARGGVPVHVEEVPEVRDARPVLLEDPLARGFGLAVPRPLKIEDALKSEVEPARSAAEGPTDHRPPSSLKCGERVQVQVASGSSVRAHQSSWSTALRERSGRPATRCMRSSVLSWEVVRRGIEAPR
jgi:hypothetical protein